MRRTTLAPRPPTSPAIARVRDWGLVAVRWGREATVQMFKPNQGSVQRRIDRSITVIRRALFSVLVLLVLCWLVSQGIRAI